LRLFITLFSFLSINEDLHEEISVHLPTSSYFKPVTIIFPSSLHSRVCIDNLNKIRYFYVPIHSISEQHLLPYTTTKVVFKICFLNLCLSFGLLTPDDG
jgi:hypothetical protein